MQIERIRREQTQLSRSGVACAPVERLGRCLLIFPVIACESIAPISGPQLAQRSEIEEMPN